MEESLKFVGNARLRGKGNCTHKGAAMRTEWLLQKVWEKVDSLVFAFHWKVRGILR